MSEHICATPYRPSVPIDVALVRERHTEAEEVDTFWAWLMVARWVPALLDEIVELRRRLRAAEDLARRRVDATAGRPVDQDEDIWLGHLSATILGE